MYAEEEWQDARETWRRGRGDCEDMAVTVKALCDEAGVESQVMVLASSTADQAHAITVGQADGVTWISSNGSYETLATNDNVRDHVARNMGWWPDDVVEYSPAMPSAPTRN